MCVSDMLFPHTHIPTHTVRCTPGLTWLIGFTEVSRGTVTQSVCFFGCKVRANSNGWASVCACFVKYNISFITEKPRQWETGSSFAFGHKLTQKQEFEQWTVVVRVGCTVSYCDLHLKLHQWEHLRLRWHRRSSLKDAEHQIQVYIQQFEQGG